MALSTEVIPFGFSDIPLDSFSLGFWRDRIEGHIRNPRAHGFEDTSLRIDRYTLKLTCNAECWQVPLSLHTVLGEIWNYIPIGTSLTLGKTEAAVDFTGKAEKNGAFYSNFLSTTSQPSGKGDSRPTAPFSPSSICDAKSTSSKRPT